MQWIVAHWMEVLLAVLAIDKALMPLFPSAHILVAIYNFLSGLVGGGSKAE